MFCCIKLEAYFLIENLKLAGMVEMVDIVDKLDMVDKIDIVDNVNMAEKMDIRIYRQQLFL